MLKSLVWLNLQKSRRKWDLNAGSSALEADALTTRPTRRWTLGVKHSSFCSDVVVFHEWNCIYCVVCTHTLPPVTEEAGCLPSLAVYVAARGHQVSRKVSFLSCLFRGLADRWGTTVDFTTSFLHSLWFSAFGSMIFHSWPVHSLMLSSHRFLCLRLGLPPWIVPCRIVLVLASPDDCVMCPYHFSVPLFTEVRRSSYGPMAFPILAFISSLIMWSLYKIPRSSCIAFAQYA